jgi:hypothetical protein
VLAVAIAVQASARAERDEAVNKAIERGVNYLKTHQSADGSWPFVSPAPIDDSSHPVGVSGLVALALLECNVPPTDPVIQKAAQGIRQSIRSLDATYDLSVALMFLDRLGNADDELLLEAIALSLAAGQAADGGWGYTCPLVTSEAELRRLRTQVEQKNSGRRDSQPTPQPTGEIRRRDQGGRGPGMLGPDNSNTQFATLALWIARRHHIPVDKTLAFTESRFRRSQNNDGGWGYHAFAIGPMASSTASMTCAGLLALAVGHGVSRQAVLHTETARGNEAARSRAASLPDPRQDRAVRRGMEFLSKTMEPALKAGPAPILQMPEAPGGFRGGRGGFRGGRGGISMGQSILGNGLSSEFYFLWSMERVAVVYGITKIGNKDWYAVGSHFILAHQGFDGAWKGNLGESVDTSFALFFLRRANLATDLTATLRGMTAPPEIAGEKRKETREETPRQEVHQPEPKVEPKPAARPMPTPHEESPPAPAEKKAAVEPAPDTDFEARKAAWFKEELLKAAPADQGKWIQRLQDSKGGMYTDALAAVIPQLRGESKTQARDALAERLSRMKPITLQDKLKDKDSEIRRAAALASAMKEEKSLIPALIDLLGDGEHRVSRAAHAALKALTKEDFGPADGASKDAQSDAIDRWREWWSERSGKRP